MIWASPALQDLTIEDVVQWWGHDDYTGLAAAIRNNITDGQKLKLPFVGMAITFVKSSFPLQNDPEALAVVLSRMSLLQLFQERSCQ